MGLLAVPGELLGAEGFQNGAVGSSELVLRRASLEAFEGSCSPANPGAFQFFFNWICHCLCLLELTLRCNRSFHKHCASLCSFVLCYRKCLQLVFSDWGD